MDLSKWAMKRIPEILKEAEFSQKGVELFERVKSSILFGLPMLKSAMARLHMCLLKYQ